MDNLQQRIEEALLFQKEYNESVDRKPESTVTAISVRKLIEKYIQLILDIQVRINQLEEKNNQKSSFREFLKKPDLHNRLLFQLRDVPQKESILEPLTAEMTDFCIGLYEEQEQKIKQLEKQLLQKEEAITINFNDRMKINSEFLAKIKGMEEITAKLFHLINLYIGSNDGILDSEGNSLYETYYETYKECLKKELLQSGGFK